MTSGEDANLGTGLFDLRGLQPDAPPHVALAGEYVRITQLPVFTEACANQQVIDEANNAYGSGAPIALKVAWILETRVAKMVANLSSPVPTVQPEEWQYLTEFLGLPFCASLTDIQRQHRAREIYMRALHFADRAGLPISAALQRGEQEAAGISAPQGIPDPDRLWELRLQAMNGDNSQDA